MNDIYIESLTESLVYFSDGKLTNDKAEQIARIVIPSVDFDNPIVQHKGMRFVARQLLDRIDLDEA